MSRQSKWVIPWESRTKKGPLSMQAWCQLSHSHLTVVTGNSLSVTNHQDRAAVSNYCFKDRPGIRGSSSSQAPLTSPCRHHLDSKRRLTLINFPSIEPMRVFLESGRRQVQDGKQTWGSEERKKETLNKVKHCWISWASSSTTLLWLNLPGTMIPIPSPPPKVTFNIIWVKL